MARTITLKFEQDDIEYAREHGFKNTVLRLLSLRSRTLWRMSDCGVGIEIIPPHYMVIVAARDQQRWTTWMRDGIAGPCRLHLNVHQLLDERDSHQATSKRRAAEHPLLRQPVAGPALADTLPLEVSPSDGRIASEGRIASDGRMASGTVHPIDWLSRSGASSEANGRTGRVQRRSNRRRAPRVPHGPGL